MVNTWLILTVYLMMFSGKVFCMVACCFNKQYIYSWFMDRTEFFFKTTLTFTVISVHLRTDLYFLWWFKLPTATELSISQHIDFSHTHSPEHSSCLLKHTHHALALSATYNVSLTVAWKNLLGRTEHETSLLTSHNSCTGSRFCHDFIWNKSRNHNFE